MSVMKKVIKFLRLPFVEKYLLIKCILLLTAIRLGLSLLSFKAILNLLDGNREKHIVLKNNEQLSPDKISWSVEVASRHVPLTTCLIKALTTKVLLARQGYQSSLNIGVTKSEKGHLDAHAWVESEGRIVIGGLKDLSRYAPLPPINEERP